MAKEVRLSDGRTALFDDDATDAFINKTLSDQGLERAGMLAKINEPIVSGLASIAGLPGAFKAGVSAVERPLDRLIANILRPGAEPPQMPEELKRLELLANAPTPGQIQERVREAGVPMARAESMPGQVAQSFVRNVVSAPVRGAALPAALSAVGEEVAAVPFRGTAQEPMARAVGAITAPFAAAPFALRSPIQARISEQMAQVSPAEKEAAQRLMQEAPTPVTALEALQRATGEARGLELGGITKLPSIQRQIEASPTGGPVMGEFMAGREAQTAETIKRMFPQESRETMGIEAQRAAEAALRAGGSEVSRLGGPAFKQIEQLTIPQADFANLLKNDVFKSAYNRVKSLDVWKEQTKGLPDTSVGFMEVVRKELRDRAKKYNISGDTEKARVLNNAYDDLKNAVDASLGGQYQQALSQYRNLRQAIEEPIQASPIGRLAETSDTAQQYGRVFATNAAELNIVPAQVSDTVRAMKVQDPMLAQEFVANYIKSQLELIPATARRELRGGARFAESVFGNETQRQNLLAAVGTAYGPEARKGMDNLIRALKTQAERLPVGSPTAEKQQLLESTQTLTKRVGKPFEAVSGLADSIMNRRDMEKLARAITSPDGIKQLERMALAGKDQRKTAIATQSLQRLMDELE
jgi:hypothetical protein